MLNQNCPRPELTKSCNLLSPGVWATDPLNRKQPDIILARQEIRIIYRVGQKSVPIRWVLYHRRVLYLRIVALQMAYLPVWLLG